MTHSIGVVGVGSMGTALVEGLLAAGHKPSALSLVDRHPDKLAGFEARGVKASLALDAMRDVDWVVVAVKPYALLETLGALAGYLKPDVVVISVAAGIGTGAMEKVLGEVAVIRSMPNTPALVGGAMTGVASGRWVTSEQLEGASTILGAVGEVVVVAEDDLDALTAISGSGPAYVFYLGEAMIAAAVDLGLAHDVADRLVRQTLRGAGQLLAASDVDASELRRRVTSKGGTTEAAIERFESGNMQEIIHHAITAAAQRSRELRSDT